MEDNMIENIVFEIINSYDINLILSISKDIELDFMDIFPKSQIERTEIEIELRQKAKCIEKEEKGEYYLLNTPINTILGVLRVVKLRIFDNKKNKRGTMDFKSSYYEQIKKIVRGKKDVYIISKSKDELIEIPIGDNFIYFSNSPKSL